MLDDDIITEETAGSWPGGEEVSLFQLQKTAPLDSGLCPLEPCRMETAAAIIIIIAIAAGAGQLLEVTEDSHEAQKKPTERRHPSYPEVVHLRCLHCWRKLLTSRMWRDDRVLSHEKSSPAPSHDTLHYYPPRPLHQGSMLPCWSNKPP